MSDNRYGLTIRLAMHVNDEGEAHQLFEVLVQEYLQLYRSAEWTRNEAERNVRGNLGYMAGYYDNETRERVERLFQCEHPIFGSIAKNGPPTPEQGIQSRS